jgi:hypothetical protein
MTRPSSLLCLAVVAAYGCGGGAAGGSTDGPKSNIDAATAGPSGQLMFLDNGASKTESVLPTFSRNYLQSPNDFLQVVALQPINGSAGAFNFTLLGADPLAPGSFTCDGSDTVTVGHVRLSYNPAADDTGQIPSDCTLTVLAVPDTTSAQITGTFSGTITTSKSGSHAITAGAFDLTVM